MLINLSNHPFDKWTPTQQEAARAQYSTVVDMPFPQIDPKASTDELRMLVDRFVADINRMPPATVHVMGELCFVYQFVAACEAIGILCVASTTHRIVEEVDGKKVVQFQFIQFRPYF